MELSARPTLLDGSLLMDFSTFNIHGESTLRSARQCVVVPVALRHLQAASIKKIRSAKFLILLKNYTNSLTN